MKEEIWQPSEGHLIERKCVEHNVRACFICGAIKPLIERLEKEEQKQSEKS
jgi:phosphoribosyl-dephospho-CoA transferase